MAKLTKKDVLHVAKLAKIPLKDEEIRKYTETLSSIVELVSKLQVVNTDSVSPTSQVTGQVNVFRQDEVDSTRVLSQKEALSNAKKTHNGYFAVSKVFEK